MENKTPTEAAEEIVKNLEPNILSTIIIIGVALLILFVVSKIVKHVKQSSDLNHNGSDNKMIVTIGRIIKTLVVLITVFLVLEVNGISVSVLVAVFGLIGAAITLAAQDVMKDVINGMYISGEKMYSPGDYIRYKDAEGKVLDFSLRSTKIEFIADNRIMYISNRNISEITIISKINMINLPMSYGLPLEKAEEIVNAVVKKMEDDDRVEKIAYLGVQELDGSSIGYRVKYECEPCVRGGVGRAIKRTFLLELDRHGESVPYNKLEIINITPEKS